MKPIKFISLLLTAMVSFTAPAEESKEEKPAESKPAKVVFKKSEQHRFSGAMLKGQVKKPELSYIYERKGLRQEQIVNIPEDFNDEIVTGASEL